MKKIWYFIRNLFVGIFVGVALILSPLVIAIRTPFDYHTYKKSHFYRETGTKFSPAIRNSETYRLYELIREHALPILYRMPHDPKQALNGFFLAGSTLLIHDLHGVFYEEALGGWTASPADKEPLTDTVAQILLRLRSDYPNEDVTNVKILMSLDDEPTTEDDRLRQDPLFLVYDNFEELPQLLRELCDL